MGNSSSSALIRSSSNAAAGCCNGWDLSATADLSVDVLPLPLLLDGLSGFALDLRNKIHLVFHPLNKHLCNSFKYYITV